MFEENVRSTSDSLLLLLASLWGVAAAFVCVVVCGEAEDLRCRVMGGGLKRVGLGTGALPVLLVVVVEEEDAAAAAVPVVDVL